MNEHDDPRSAVDEQVEMAESTKRIIHVMDAEGEEQGRRPRGGGLASVDLLPQIQYVNR